MIVLPADLQSELLPPTLIHSYMYLEGDLNFKEVDSLSHY